MTPERNEPMHDDEAENGVLADGANLDMAGIGILGAPTAQVDVVLPQLADDDDDANDEAVDDSSFPGEGFVPVHFGTEGVEVVAAEDVTVDDETDAHPVVSGLADGEEFAEEVDDTASRDGEASDEDGDDADADDADAAAVMDDTADETEAADVEAVAADEAAADETGDAASPADETTATAAATGGLEAASAASALAAQPATGSVPTTTGSLRTATGSLRTATQAPSASTPASVAQPKAQSALGPAGDSAATDDDLHPRLAERRRSRTEELAPRRLGEFEQGRESADLLTADRLLDPHHVVKPEPEGAWQHFVYSISGRRINLGDGRRARRRKELDRRIAAGLQGSAKFVPVMSRKGGVGKTTITTLLGMALADARDDRIIAVDANPDRGTLAERVGNLSGKTVRDLVRRRGEISGYHDLSTIVARDETRLDVLASDTDPHVSEAFSDRDYQAVAEFAAHYYSVVLTDTGTGIVHSVMESTLDLADAIIVVTGLSVDEARLASETLTWLESNGRADLARNAVVVLNASRPGAPLVRPEELESHFRTRVRAVVRVPYDPQIAAGSKISFRELQPETRQASRELAAIVVEGLRGLTSAA